MQIKSKPLKGTSINYSHPLARDLKCAWVFNEASGSKCYDSTLNQISGNLVGLEFGGGGVKFPASGDNYINFGNPFNIRYNHFTLSINARVLDSTAALLCKTEASSADGRWGLYVDTDVLYALFDVGPTRIIQVASPFTDGKFHTVTATFIQGAYLDLYVDGVFAASSNPTTIGYDSNTNFNILIGRYDYSNATYYLSLNNGIVSNAFIWFRALTPAEVRLLHYDPYCIFRTNTYGKLLISGVIAGTTCWGHSTGVTEVNTRTFAGHGSGTATITGTGDSEKLAFMPGDYWEFEQVNTGEETITITQNQYNAGDDVTIKYRTGADEAACTAASYSTYTVPVASSGIFQVKLERAA